MSQENIEIVRRAYEAFDRRDFETVLGLGSPDFELDISAHPIPDFPNVGTGTEHMAGFFATYLAGFSDYTMEPTEIIDGGDKVVAACHDTARLGPGAVERDFTHVWTVTAGKLVRLQVFKTIEEALKAAGLLEATSREGVDVLRQFIDTWQRNIDVLRLFVDAFNRRDLPALLSSCDPDIEIVSGGVLIGTPMYRGQRGIEQWFRDMAVAWEELRSEARGITAVGENSLVVLGDSYGKGKTAGVPFEVHDMAVHFKFLYARVARCEFFANEREALEAAGLRE
jgi:ketosteroid isomerase-like protein